MVSFDFIGVIKSNLVISSIAGLIGIIVIAGQPAIRRIYLGYAVALAVALAAALQTGSSLYFFAFALGFLTAFTEIIGKFTDEPIKALGTGSALVYHVSNGAISSFALWVLLLGNFLPSATAFDKLKIVTMAGLGSMLIMRSRLFEAKIGDENVSFGPEQLIKVFFKYMEKAIDRVRSENRIEFVQSRLKNIDCRKVIPYVVTMLDAPQTLDRAAKDELESKMDKITSDEPSDVQYKSYRLGFLLLNEMGEDFVARLFRDPQPEWLIAAQKPGEKKGLFARLPFVGAKEEYVNYFAYGKSMSLNDLVKRLNWAPSDMKKLLAEKPRPCVVKNYRLEFSGPSSDGSTAGQGCANLAPAEGERVWGVLLRLPKRVLEFLDAAERGYRQRAVTCLVDGSVVEAIAFTASSPLAGLLPAKDYVAAMVRAGEEHGLDAGYIDNLRKSPTLERPIAVKVAVQELAEAVRTPPWDGGL